MLTRRSDIDLLCYWFSPQGPARVSSFGSLQHFRKSAKPAAAGSATRCIECPAEKECPYSAKKSGLLSKKYDAKLNFCTVYLEPVSRGNTSWPASTIVDGVPDIENITEALKSGPYGKCVYESANDVADHQVVNLEFSGGATASFTMVAYTSLICDRQTRLHFTHGEIVGDMESFVVTNFRTGEKKTHNPVKELGGGHGGGDLGLISAFVEAVRTGNQELLGTDVKEVLRSHMTVFAAETSRREGRVVDCAEYEKEDKSLLLRDGRTLAYADNGNTSSSVLVLYLHGPFSVGDASHLPRALLNAHYVAPSMPGWGRSSPLASVSNYPATLAADITALIAHLHPHTHHKLRLYICAHAFGTVPAQILYSLPHNKFPLARQLAALVLIAPCSPPHCHPAYARSLPWLPYLLAGPLARYVPGFRLLATHLTRLALSPYLSSHASAQSLCSTYFLPPVDPEPSLDDNSYHDDLNPQQNDPNDGSQATQDESIPTQSQLVSNFGRNAYRSVAASWRGFTDMPIIYHSGWGAHFDPANIQNTCPVLVVSAENDSLAPKAMANWLVASYKNARLKTIPGGHLSAFFHLDGIWSDVFQMEIQDPSSSQIHGESSLID
ncbi:hypothetical protein H0H92_004822 [Tricholoma furcatifolium]|nr:hypothetical protein H0H92_004822 [Tricholoma furcatifolium]